MSTPEVGQFITLEGIEGVGKSTNLQFVADYLRRTGRTVVVTREPGGVAGAERIRELLLDTALSSMPPMSELLLMFAARALHLDELVKPALAQGAWVVCDRFTDASYAYQGGGRGISQAVVGQLEQMVQGEFRPDLTLLLDADWRTTQPRRARRGVEDRFEGESADFFTRVRSVYLARARAEPHRIFVVDASQTLPDVRSSIAAILERRLKALEINVTGH